MKLNMKSLLEKIGFAIEDMEEGIPYDVRDKKVRLLSFDHRTKKNGYKLVEKVIYKGVHPVWEAVTDGGYVLLRGKSDHIIYDVRKGVYVRFCDVEDGYCLLETGEETYFKITQTKKKEPIVDIQIEDENYFTNSILSHNTTFHTYAESNDVPWEKVRDFIKKVIYNSRLPYVTWSPTIKVCQRHGMIMESTNGNVCPLCLEEAKTEYRNKRAELEERKSNLLKGLVVSGDCN
jgi:hypothetical protein